jgi:hypothetical protein
MTPEQYKKAEELQKQINNHKGIFNMLHDASNALNNGAEIKFMGHTYRLPERLIHEFMHATTGSLTKLETEFNEL